jgi:hypothetical protein
MQENVDCLDHRHRIGTHADHCLLCVYG